MATTSICERWWAWVLCLVVADWNGRCIGLFLVVNEFDERIGQEWIGRDRAEQG